MTRALLLLALTSTAYADEPAAATTEPPAATPEAAPEATSNVDTRRTYLRLDAGFGAPEGLFGGVLGYAVRRHLAVEVGAGLGITGLQLALLGRYYVPIGGSRWASWSFAAGPSVGLLSESLGLNVPHTDDVTVDEGDFFYYAGLNAEVGIELRARWGGLVRFAFGGFLRVAENMSGLCTKDTGSGSNGCDPPHLPSAPEVAELQAFPYMTMGYGFSW